MTKKLTLLSVGAVGALTLAACTPSLQGAPKSSAIPAASASPAAQGGGLMDIAKNIMAGQGYQCTFKLKKTGQEIKYSIKGKKVAMTMEVPKVSGMSSGTSNIIADQDVMYFWDPATKKGMKMTVPKEGATPVPGAPADNVPDFSDVNALTEMQKEYDVSCTPAQLNDAMFIPPTDVEFQDLSAMMKNIPAMPSAAPTAMPAMPADYQKYMQQ